MAMQQINILWIQQNGNINPNVNIYRKSDVVDVEGDDNPNNKEKNYPTNAIQIKMEEYTCDKTNSDENVTLKNS